MRTRLLAALGAMAMQAATAAPTCHVDRFQGATLPQGAVAHMVVVNVGEACNVTTYGANLEQRENPSYAGEITVAPEHGTASFEAPKAFYMPAAGFVGNDRFSFEAFAKDSIGRSKRLRVQVDVTVLAPQHHVQARHSNSTARKVGYGESAEPLLRELIARSPAVVDQVRAELPAGVSHEVADKVPGGLLAAARALEAEDVEAI